MKVHTTLFFAVALMSTATTGLAQQSETNTVPVTVTNFPRAETDMYFGGMVKDGALGKFTHRREPTSADQLRAKSDAAL
ncbi:hypothetical protein [Rhizobium leguminosarum]|uniref:hypothetical protein n=1 Tax=Rhizobium leguminosarum TaxID=384 RepID=UPI0018D4DD5F|nr:hypothetical protein [Rhizobium leguminosarum]